MLKMDLSGLEAVVVMCENIKEELPKMDAEFMRREWYLFLDKVEPIVMQEAYDTGNMLHSFKLSEIRQEHGLTEADFENLATYASFNNYGFTHYISGEKIPGVFWWERAFNSLAQGRGKRYSEMLQNLIEAR